MKLLWEKEDENDTIETITNGCVLDDNETRILIKLSGKLSVDNLSSLGMDCDEIRVVQNWYYVV